MRRHELKRIARDLLLDEALASPDGRTEYWTSLSRMGRCDSKIGLLESTLHLPGDVIECGVYRGGSLMKIARAVAQHAPEKTIFACDSFEGFPEERVGRVDVGFFRLLSRIRRKFKTCTDTPDRLSRFFEYYGVRGQIVKGFFDQTLSQLDGHRFCFIHLDCDLYDSYRTCLDKLYSRLTPGGVVVFDDFGSSKWPGATKAVSEFFDSEPASVTHCSDRDLPAWYVRKPYVETLANRDPHSIAPQLSELELRPTN